MSIIRWNPVRDPWLEMKRAQEEMDRLFRSLWSNDETGRGAPGLFPAMNLSADKEQVKIRCEMPGVPQEKIDLSIDRDTLTIKGQRELEQKGSDVSYHRRERRGGYFNRTLSLPFEVDPEKASAKYSNGVLEVTVQRAEASKPRQVSIKVD